MTARRAPGAAPGTEAERRQRRLERLISDVLRFGVVASLILIVIGTILSFVHHPSYLSSAAEFERLSGPEAAFPHTWGAVAAGLGDLQGQAVVALGLMLLIATPILRVALSLAAFAYQKDRAYTLITLAVLSMLLLSFALGRVE
jgi:uncharacterized membrane protein